MFRFVRDRSKKSGLPPGTLVHIGEKKAVKAKITVMDYDEAHYEEKEVETVEECLPLTDRSAVTWINIDGIHEVDIIEKIGEHFGVHPLIQEDIANTEQRPKMDDLGEHMYIVLKMLYYDNEVNSEQISFILGRNFLVSFQEKEGDVFDGVRGQIRNGIGRIRKMGADYLCYALMDAVVDNYFALLEIIGEKIENTEELLLAAPTSETLESIQLLKREMMVLRKSVWPLREVVSRLEREESQLVKGSTKMYLRDVYDHTIQVIDTIETFRDMLSEMLDIYLSSVSNRMNEVMKVLTIIATIFIPLTFLAGVYGMNFMYMPELEKRWGYPVLWVVMIGISLIMIVYFKRKKWL